MIYFTADWHLHHKNIIRFCNRPFKTVKAMHKALINNFNSRVRATDVTYHIGDFTMMRAGDIGRLGKLVSELNGTHHLILGNHDYLKPFQYIDIGFTSVHTSLVIEYGETFILNHDPSVYCLLNKEQYLLHGHIHTLYRDLLPAKKSINVGVDVWDFKPVNGKEILNLIKEKGASNDE